MEVNMFKHHEETIRNITDKLKVRDDVLAILVSGSVAHGFAKETSDVDLMIVVSDQDYQKRLKTGDIHYFEQESCTYDSGYIDGKYISTAFMKQVADSGSEPARFAFEGAYATYSAIEEIDGLIKGIIRYPVEKKIENITRFYAQFEAWKWYCEEAIKHDNLYLFYQSLSNFILFSGRLILAYNEILYPYHKWFLRVLEGAEAKPKGLMASIHELLEEKDRDKICSLYHQIKTFRDWEVSEQNWPVLFMWDSELNWLQGSVPVADI